MNQPKKENTKEEIKKIHTLLIDGNGLLKMSIEGDKDKFDRKGKHIGGIYQFMLQLRNLIDKRNWDFIYVFWDGDKSGKLRFDYLQEYKANRGKVYGDYGLELKDYMAKILAKVNKDDINKREDFKRQKNSLMSYLPELFIRQITDEIVESDDFIAYYVKNKQKNEVITIITGDRDIFQLLDESIYIYDLSVKYRKENNGSLVTKQNFKNRYGYLSENIKTQKILLGDASDNIKGVKGLGDKTLFAYFPELLKRKVELSEIIEKAKVLQNERIKLNKKPLQALDNIINGVTIGTQGKNLYEINEKIIDLNNPILTKESIEEIEAYMYAPMDPDGRSLENVYRLMIKDDIYQLFNDEKFVNFFIPFKRYINNEIIRYKNLTTNYGKNY